MVDPKLRPHLDALLLDLGAYLDEHLDNEFENEASRLSERITKMVRYINKHQKSEPDNVVNEPFKSDMMPSPNMNESPNNIKSSILQEEISRIKGMMKLNEENDFDDLSDQINPYSQFESPEELLNSINGRLITSIQLKEWELVKEVSSDVFNFVKNK